MTVNEAWTLKLPHYCSVCGHGYLHGVVWIGTDLIVICTDCLKSSQDILGNLQKDSQRAIKEETEHNDGIESLIENE